MYDRNKYGYVTVIMEKTDSAINSLEEDLKIWESRLGRVEKKDVILYRGLLPKKGIENLELLRSVSPYGRGYKITVN